MNFFQMQAPPRGPDHAAGKEVVYGRQISKLFASFNIGYIGDPNAVAGHPPPGSGLLPNHDRGRRIDDLVDYRQRWKACRHIFPDGDCSRFGHVCLLISRTEPRDFGKPH